MTTPAVVGIDIGGSKISLCAAGRSGEVLGARRIATGSEDGAAAVVDRFMTATAALVAEVEGRCGVRVRGVGIVSPGVVQPEGVQPAPDNLGWEQLPLAATVRERLGLDARSTSRRGPWPTSPSPWIRRCWPCRAACCAPRT